MSSAAAFVAVASAVIAVASARGPSALAGRVRPPSDSEPLPPPLSGAGWAAESMVELGFAPDLSSARLIARCSGAGLLALATVVGGLPVAVVLGVVVLVAAPVPARRLLARRRVDRRDAQLPTALERLASSLRAGIALGPALVAVAEATPDPLGTEIKATASLVEHGSGLPAALHDWGARADASPDMRLASAALGLAAEVGGEVARSVDRVAATVRERRELRAEARALATQARASAAVLAMAPLAFTALVASVEPAAVTFLLTSPVGLGCLTAGVLLEALGAAWMARILRSVA